MTDRKQKIEELIEGFHSLRHAMVFQTAGTVKMPRITPSQWGVLMFVEQHGESKVKDVAKALGVTSSATTQLVDGLVESRYLIRKMHAEDRRTVTLSLSKKSKNQVEKMKKHAIGGFLKIFETLSDKEFNQYLALNKKIVQRFMLK